jgi:hypothetical protein
MGSIKAWKAVEVEKATIRSLFLENTIDIATHRYHVKSSFSPFELPKFLLDYFEHPTYLQNAEPSQQE